MSFFYRFLGLPNFIRFPLLFLSLSFPSPFFLPIPWLQYPFYLFFLQIPCGHTFLSYFPRALSIWKPSHHVYNSNHCFYLLFIFLLHVAFSFFVTSDNTSEFQIVSFIFSWNVFHSSKFSLQSLPLPSISSVLLPFPWRECSLTSLLVHSDFPLPTFPWSSKAAPHPTDETIFITPESQIINV